MQDHNFHEKEGQEIDLTRVFRVLFRMSWLILAATLIVSAAGYIYASTFVTPVYRSGFTAYVNNRITLEGEDRTSTADLSASVGLSHVYKKIIESRTVLQSAMSACGNVDLRKIRGVTAQVSETAPVLAVYVDATDAVLARQLADAVAQVAPEQVAKIVEGSSMRMIDAPQTPVAPYSPNRMLYATYGAVAGLVLSVLLLLMADLARDYVQSGEDVENRYGIPVIGKIPDMLQAEKTEDHYGYGKAVGKR